MLKEGIRAAILQLAAQGHSYRAISKAVRVSRSAVRRVIVSGRAQAPHLEREEKAEPFRDEILHQLAECHGNLVRVHEQLVAAGAAISYQGLTAFCRRHGIGVKPKKPVGHYDFGPGDEMQHDTSPHRIHLGGKIRLVQTASLVLCLCRMLFFMFFPCFRRFECKVFLTEAIAYMQGACHRCMIDNTHVVVSSGTGRDMVPAPEMESFGRRFGFTFAAHAVGNANRSGRVERPFHFIENNFLAGRKFADWQDANRQARDWCDRINRSYKRHLKAKPIDLYTSERPHLQPLPIYAPDPIEILHRIVDVERFVSVDTNRYSVPCELIGRTVEVHKSWKQIIIYYGGKIVATHNRLIDPADARVLLPEHHFPRGESRRRQEKLPEEQTLSRIIPEIEQYLSGLKKRGRATTLTLRRLIRMAQEYPRQPFLRALTVATQYGLYDLERLERLILRYIADDFFQLSGGSDDQGEENE